MHPPGYYREQAEHARRMLERMAEDFEDIACDLETGAVDMRHPELLPQLRRER